MSSYRGASKQRMQDASLPDNAFDYTPLNTSEHQIRLLNFRKEEEDIHCQVSVFQLEEAPPYRALSYTWGPPSPTYDIYMAGKRHMVRENLYRFLRKMLQGKTKYEYLWIDQLSIDQINIHERNHQVAMMADIYKRAVAMIMWLGDNIGAPSINMGSGRILAEPRWTLRAVSKLLRDSYFTRLWIIQEFLLSQTVEIVTAGEAMVDFLTIRDAAFRCDVQLKELGVPQSTLELFWSRPRNGIVREYHGGSLDRLLDSFHGNTCIDPRDKVYGLLGLCHDHFKFPIDYSKSVQEVFLDSTMALYKVYRSTQTAISKDSGSLYEDYERSVDMLSNHKIRDSLGECEILFRTWTLMKKRMSDVDANNNTISPVPRRSTCINHRAYHRILSILSREMLSDRSQLEAVTSMLWELWKPMKYETFDDHGYPALPLVTAMGFDEASNDQNADLAIREYAKPTQARWWFEHSGEVHVFKCIE